MNNKPSRALQRRLNRHLNWLLGRRLWWRRYKWEPLHIMNVGRVIPWGLFKTGACAAITFVYVNGEHLYFVIESEGDNFRVTAWQADPRWTVIGPLFGTDNGGNQPTVIRNPADARDFIQPGRKYGFS